MFVLTTDMSVLGVFRAWHSVRDAKVNPAKSRVFSLSKVRRVSNVSPYVFSPLTKLSLSSDGCGNREGSIQRG